MKVIYSFCILKTLQYDAVYIYSADIILSFDAFCVDIFEYSVTELRFLVISENETKSYNNYSFVLYVY